MLGKVRSVVCSRYLKISFSHIVQKQFINPSSTICRDVQVDFTKVKVNKNVQDVKDLVDNVFNDIEDSLKELEEYSDIFQDQDMPIPVKKLLYSVPIDFLMSKLNSCASVQEVFDLIKSREANLKPEHIAQAVLVLWDLQKMFYHVNLLNNTLTNQSNIITDLAENYYKKLSEHPDFKLLLSKIEQNCDRYDCITLATILIYLERIGMNVKAKIAQLLIRKFNEKAEETPDDIPISALARLTTALFKACDLSSYYSVKQYIPNILNYIENSQTIEEFKHCTTCLSNMNKIVTDDVMDEYVSTVQKHLDSGFLDGSDPKAILTIIMFLNYPQWRDSNTRTISKATLLIKDKIHLLNSYELLLFYEVFYKTQEPALLLTPFQRHAGRYLAHFEDESVPLLDIRLRLLLAVISHSSLAHRPHYAHLLRQHTAYHLNRNSIFQFYKLLVYTKSGDYDVSRKLWGSIEALLLDDEVFREGSLLRVCVNYLHFVQTVHSYRFYKLEKLINKLLEKQIIDGNIALYPNKFACAAIFIIAFSRNRDMVELVISRLERYHHRINHVECLNYTKALNYANEIKNPLMTKTNVDRLQRVLTQALLNNVDNSKDINVNNMLFKSCIHNADGCEMNTPVASQLIANCVDNSTFSTRIMKNLAFCLYSTQSLLPKVMDNMVAYIIEGKDHVLGSNVEKVLHLCYFLGYLPKNAQQFFEVTTEIILRDQERFSGLSYLQCCLALCYFQSLPHSFIKQIFNTVFLDKLDNELAHCYHKDIYPIRVRHLMMQLNRAVCIDYPEINVPWFHQKYINELLKRASRTHDNALHILIKSYLVRILDGPGYIQENITTPYGYNINFVLHLDEDDQFVQINQTIETTQVKKIAMLLVKPKDFTNVQTQLMGKTLLKIRHLEILGYKVLLLDIPIWKNIVSGYEKIEYLRKLISVPNSQIHDAINL